VEVAADMIQTSRKVDVALVQEGQEAVEAVEAVEVEVEVEGRTRR